MTDRVAWVRVSSYVPPPGNWRDAVACYDRSGGFLRTPLEQLLVNAAAWASA